MPRIRIVGRRFFLPNFSIATKKKAEEAGPENQEENPVRRNFIYSRGKGERSAKRTQKLINEACSGKAGP